MAVALQYDFFEEVSDISELKKELAVVKMQSENVRKGLFARNKKLETALNELLNLYLQQQEEIANLKQTLIR